MNNSGGLGTASFIELTGVLLWRSAPRFDRILYSSFRATFTQARRESRGGSPRQGCTARFRGFTRHRPRIESTDVVQSPQPAAPVDSFWCMRAILHFFGERVYDARTVPQADIRAATPR
ncbi:hypothetical protein [Burkholderia metallica]|uniref:hypothetical protein n=1 Tax=Burkholderia metallica TaxID=488729 RepID=UPI00157A84A1|nr:hypothetical protein [Burkholderia metallica]